MLTSTDTKKMPGVLFHALHRAHMNAVHAELTARGLAEVGSPLILLILRSRGADGEIASQRELAQALRVSPATIATSLKSLERLGYVEKRLDDRDNRRNRVAITEKGRAAVEECFQVYQAVDRRMLDGLTDQERDDLDRLHWKLLSNLGPDILCKERGDCP